MSEKDNTINKPITLKDFKSWLQGVEDMQEEGWVPNAVQWKKIREKIEQIIETPIQNNLQQKHSFMETAVSFPTQHFVRPPMEPSALETTAKFSTTFVPPSPSSILDNPKTPDIDTSHGQYTSSFI